MPWQWLYAILCYTIIHYEDPLLARLGGRPLRRHFRGAADGVRIRDLLHMTSGIPDYDDGAYSDAQFRDRARDFGPAEILRDFVGRRLDFAPGTRQAYCSTNYVILGLVLLAHQRGNPLAWQELLLYYSIKSHLVL